MQTLAPMSDEVPIVRVDASGTKACLDQVAIEEPLEIRVRGRAISVTMRTPGHDDELAAGFLLSEGMIHRASDVLKIEPCERNDAGNLFNVQLTPLVAIDLEK